MDDVRLISGNANRALAEEIAQVLGMRLAEADVSAFPDGETRVQINENVRGADVFVIQPTCRPVNTSLMELLIIIDALRRASARRITAVMPYYGYARQDRKVRPRVPISSKLVANLLTVAGTDRVLAMDLHAGQIQGFFDIPVDHLYAAPVMIQYIAGKKLDDLVVVSPDAGGVERARAYAKRLHCPMAIIDKRRNENDEAEVMHVIGEVSGRTVLIVDDMIDRAGSLIEAVRGLREKGAGDIYYAATHPVFSPPAMERIRNSDLKEVVVTNTIPLRDDAVSCETIKVLSVAPLLAEAIARIHREESVSSLFV